jgi:hypothetical protein
MQKIFLEVKMPEDDFENIVGKRIIASEEEKIFLGEEDGEKKYFIKKKITTQENDGRPELITEHSLYRCGHSPEQYPNAMRCDYGCIVDEGCIRICCKGNHPVCKMHSRELEDGRVICNYH